MKAVYEKLCMQINKRLSENRIYHFKRGVWQLVTLTDVHMVFNPADTVTTEPVMCKPKHGFAAGWIRCLKPTESLSFGFCHNF